MIVIHFCWEVKVCAMNFDYNLDCSLILWIYVDYLNCIIDTINNFYKKYNKFYYINLSNFFLSKIFTFLFLRCSITIYFLISFDQDRLIDQQLLSHDILDWKGIFINCLGLLNLPSIGRCKTLLICHPQLCPDTQINSMLKVWKYCRL